MLSLSESWKEIPGTNGHYEASTRGRIRSVGHFVEWKTRWGTIGRRWSEGQILQPVEHRGYFFVSVKIGKKRAWPIHQLVALTYHGPCPDGLVIDHKNTNKADNSPDNLEYVTNPENVHRQYRTGLLSNFGETNGQTTLTDAEAAEIKRSNEPTKVLAERYGIADYTVQNIRLGKSWKHIDVEPTYKANKKPVAKLSEDTVRTIAELLKTKRPKEIADITGVSMKTVSAIKRGKCWCDVTGIPRAGKRQSTAAL